MNNSQVAKNWINGEKGKSSNGNFHTDGKDIFSYWMLIGRTMPDGTKQVLNVRGLRAYSVTTSSHVSEAIYAGNVQVIEPTSGYKFPKSKEEYSLTIKSYKTRVGAEKFLAKNAASLARSYPNAKAIRVIDYSNGYGAGSYDVVAEFVGAQDNYVVMAHDAKNGWVQFAGTDTDDYDTAYAMLKDYDGTAKATFYIKLETEIARLF